MALVISERRSNADIVFEHLKDEIMSLDLLPGAKLSEAEVAARFGVSRQPVREAFNLLSNLNLLVIQPQKATRVRLFSHSQIRTTRFARLAIELEVARTALKNWVNMDPKPFETCLEQQRQAVSASDSGAFHQLDEDFHRLIAHAADALFAFDMTKQYKAHIDRICVLSLKDEHEMSELVADHHNIFDALVAQDEAALEATLRLHLSRIEKTIDAVQVKHPNYFSD